MGIGFQLQVLYKAAEGGLGCGLTAETNSPCAVAASRALSSGVEETGLSSGVGSRLDDEEVQTFTFALSLVQPCRVHLAFAGAGFLQRRPHPQGAAR